MCLTKMKVTEENRPLSSKCISQDIARRSVCLYKHTHKHSCPSAQSKSHGSTVGTERLYCFSWQRTEFQLLFHLHKDFSLEMGLFLFVPHTYFQDGTMAASLLSLEILKQSQPHMSSQWGENKERDSLFENGTGLQILEKRFYCRARKVIISSN